jgi:hypothetical protein
MVPPYLRFILNILRTSKPFVTNVGTSQALYDIAMQVPKRR